MVIVVLGSMGGCFMMFLSPKKAFLHHAKSTLTVHQATFHDRSQTYDLHVYRHTIYMAVDPTKDAKQYGKGRFWRGWSGPYIYIYIHMHMHIWNLPSPWTPKLYYQTGCYCEED